MILEQSLCDRGNNYVKDIKNDKVALQLIEFLKKEFADFNEGEATLAQKQQWVSRVSKFI